MRGFGRGKGARDGDLHDLDALAAQPAQRHDSDGWRGRAVGLRGGGGGRGRDLLRQARARLVEGGLAAPLQGQVQLVQRDDVRPCEVVGVVKVQLAAQRLVRVRARARARVSG